MERKINDTYVYFIEFNSFVTSQLRKIIYSNTMRWSKNSKGSKIRDVRGTGRGISGGRSAGALMSIIPMLFRFLGLKGTLVVGLIAGAIFLVKPDIINMLLGGGGATTSSQSLEKLRKSPEDQEALQLINNAKSSTDRVWSNLLGVNYVEPSLDIVTDRQGTGPYYMPSTEKIHIDPQFFIDLTNRHDSPGDFAQSYVIAHEAAHHIQKLFGLTTFVHKQHGSSRYNELSVRLELHADFLSGVWAKKAIEMGHFQLEEGDLEEGINAANNIGDDVLKKKAGARNIDPSEFTHGSGEQRMAWLVYGFKTGDFHACKLFNVQQGGAISIGQSSLMPPGM